MSVSGYNIETAEGILQASGTAIVVLGALLPVIGLTPILVSNLMAIVFINDRTKQPRPLALFVMVALFIVSLVVSPVISFIPMVVSLILVVAVELLLRKAKPDNHVKYEGWYYRANTLYVAAYALLFLLIVATNNVPWIPPERIETSNANSVVGYVLNETDTDVTVLTVANRQIIHLSPGVVISRTVCDESGVIYGGIYVENLPTFLFGGNNPNYPPCQRIRTRASMDPLKRSR